MCYCSISSRMELRAKADDERVKSRMSRMGQATEVIPVLTYGEIDDKRYVYYKMQKIKT